MLGEVDSVATRANPKAKRRVPLSRARVLLPQLSWRAERAKFLDFYAGLVNGERRPARVLTAS